MSKNDDGIELNVYKSSGSGYERVATDEDNIDDELLNASNQPILNDEEVENRAADLTSDLDRGGDEESETELSPEEAERRLFLTRTEDETRGGGRNDDIELRHRGTGPKHVHYRDIDSRPGEEENLLANRTTVEEETNFGGFPVDNRGEAGSNWLDDINVIRDNSVLSKLGQLFLLTTFILAVFLVILVALPNCIFRLEYNELALTRSVWTGRVRYDKVYEPGLNFILPWYEGIIFDKAAHSYHLKELNIFTTDKLSVKTQFSIYYFLDKRNLGELYRKFGLDYKPIIESVAKTVLLNHGLEFSIDDYRTKRSEIRRVLRDKLKAKLERDYSIRILDIYLGRITFTKEINQLNLLRMLNGIFNEKAAHDKQTNVTRAETAYKISLLRNEARLVVNSAQAKADNEVRRVEEVNLNARLEYAHSYGLNNSYSQLNFFDGRPKASQRAISFCYLSALINNENVRFIQKVENTGRYVFSDLGDSISTPIEIISS